MLPRPTCGRHQGMSGEIHRLLCSHTSLWPSWCASHKNKNFFTVFGVFVADRAAEMVALKNLGFYAVLFVDQVV